LGLLLGRSTATQSVSLAGGQDVALPSDRPEDAGASVADLGRAPGFTIKTLSGETFSLEPLEGPVVLSFIAGWCTTCLQEAEAGGEIVRSFGDRGVRVLAIDADPADSVVQLKRFIKAAGNPPIQWAMDKTSEVTIAYGVRALDTTVIIDPRGRIVYRDEWPTDYRTMAAVLEETVGSERADAPAAEPPSRAATPSSASGAPASTRPPNPPGG
jgi:peroxiredoxin